MTNSTWRLRWRWLSGVPAFSYPSTLWLPQPSTVTSMMVLQSLLCRVMWPNSGVERFLSVHETFDLAPYIIIGFVLLVGNAELSREFVFESFHPFFFLASTRSVKVALRGGWIRQEICKAWTWYGSWYCSSVSFSDWPSMMWLWRDPREDYGVAGVIVW